jgi:uncharacterized protein DUF6790
MSALRSSTDAVHLQRHVCGRIYDPMVRCSVCEGLSVIVLVLYLVSIVVGLVFAAAQGSPMTLGGCGTAVLNAMTVILGCLLVSGGYLHVFRTVRMAEQVGWPPGGSFQKSVGIWNMAVGCLCIASPLVADSGFRAATVLAMSGFWCGAAFLHFWEARAATPALVKQRLMGASELLAALTLVGLLTVAAK